MATPSLKLSASISLSSCYLALILLACGKSFFCKVITSFLKDFKNANESIKEKLK